MEADVTMTGVIKSVVKSVVTLKVVLSVGYYWGYSPNGGDRVYLVPLYITIYVIVNVFQILKPYLGVTTKVTTKYARGVYCSHTGTRPPPS
jgi:hypothetical protein